MFFEIKTKIFVIKGMRSSTDFKMCLEMFQEMNFLETKQGSISEVDDFSGSVKNDWYKFAERVTFASCCLTQTFLLSKALY